MNSLKFVQLVVQTLITLHCN